jgi:hypothetical protein
MDCTEYRETQASSLSIAAVLVTFQVCNFLEVFCIPTLIRRYPNTDDHYIIMLFFARGLV